MEACPWVPAGVRADCSGLHGSLRGRPGCGRLLSCSENVTLQSSPLGAPCPHAPRTVRQVLTEPTSTALPPERSWRCMGQRRRVHTRGWLPGRLTPIVQARGLGPGSDGIAEAQVLAVLPPAWLCWGPAGSGGGSPEQRPVLKSPLKGAWRRQEMPVPGGAFHFMLWLFLLAPQGAVAPSSLAFLVPRSCPP